MARSTRSWLYAIARALGDAQAIGRGRMGHRLIRRTANREVFRAWNNLFRPKRGR